MIPKESLLKLFEKETATTVRVMRAFPSDKADFKPHGRSQDALRLMSTFVFEMYLMASYVFGDPADTERFKTYKPENVETVIEDFEEEVTRTLSRLAKLSDADLAKSVEFGGAHFEADEFALMMLHDQIHHRGQLAVYVRMAGGKVPSIYGPSADDTSTNL